jgi:hypothetical protein
MSTEAGSNRADGGPKFVAEVTAATIINARSVQLFVTSGKVHTPDITGVIAQYS